MNTYTFLMLGGRNSGKTVFLACLDRKLSTQNKEIGFFLEIQDPNNLRKLKLLYATLDPGLEGEEELWPGYTQLNDISEWIFKCRVQTNNEIYDACQFKYFDYPGGNLTEVVQNKPQLDQTMENADVILCLLDGMKIISYITGQNQGRRWAVQDLGIMLSIVQGNSKPVYFLISKWDVVKKFYSLEQVRDKLLEEPGFKNIIEGRKNVGVRLIPISSVGDGFAELQEDGSMKKTGKPAYPFQLEMPLACVLQDKIKVEIEELVAKATQIETTPVVVEANLTLFEKIKRAGGGVLKRGLEMLPNFDSDIDIDIVRSLINVTEQQLIKPVKEKEEFAKRRTQELKDKQEESLTRINDEKTAFQSVVYSFARLVDKLERDFPASKF